MRLILSYFKKRPHLLILGLILLIGLFFRTYKAIDRFEFAHDGDLYSWIVKDIVVDHHFRLIGQLTSAPGIFIGPLFYYALIPFFLLTHMDPIGVTGLGIVVGLLTIISYYLVLTKLFNRTSGFIAAFLHAVLITNIGFDRWIVPTLPAKLWAIWYLYTLIIISRGNFSVLPILGILIGLIWHIHIALIPALLAVPVSLFISRKIPSKKILLFSFTAFFITSLPLILFEFRHNFSQTISIIQNLIIPQSGENGFHKLIKVLEMIAKNNSALLFSPQSITEDLKLPILILLLASTFLLVKKRLLKFKEILIIFTWIIAIVLFFSISRTPISEYYFANLEIIFILFVSLLITIFIRCSKSTLYLTLFILIIILVRNTSSFINTKPYQVGYAYRKDVADYIARDASNRGFPCVGITYITKPGENVGFRYFFYLNKLHIVHPSLDVPVYNIILPFEYSKEVEKRIGVIGIIPPTTIPPKETIEKTCQTTNTNLTDPMLGYVD